MRLLLVRHAHAGDREKFAKTGNPDELRPLSKRGIRQMKDALPGLMALVPSCDIILTSPLIRSRQTAAILSGAWGQPAVDEPALAPDRPVTKVIDLLNGYADVPVVVAVGHEPQLGLLASRLLTGSRTPSIDFAKGGACLLEFEDGPRAGMASLRWFVGPKQLAKLASIRQADLNVL